MRNAAGLGYSRYAAVWLLASAALVFNVASAQSSAQNTAPAKAAKKAEPAVDYSLDAILKLVRADKQAEAAKLSERETRYQQRLSEAEQRRNKALATLAAREAEGRRLEQIFDGNKVELNDKAKLLKDKIGALKELFGVFQQNASDLIGAFVGSPTSLQYPDRDIWLEGFANRMKNASEVTSADDIKILWFEMQREIVARGEIVAMPAPVRSVNGDVTDKDIVRIGAFNLVTRDPQPAYLDWDAGKQQVIEMPRQPSGPYLAEIDAYLNVQQGLSNVSIDPTGGVLLSLFIEKPNLRERIDQGGLVGYMILALGVMALVLALLKLLDITIISLRVAMQQRNLNAPAKGNPLGRLLQVYQDNRQVDAETLDMRLHDRVQKEDGRINRFTVFLAIIAAVAPLMGLLGTVVGMINTFQAITLYGTGDPQTMAGGISQALITTVLGLVVAVPAVLLHAMVSARGKGMVNVLKQRAALLMGDRLEQQGQPQFTAPATAV